MIHDLSRPYPGGSKSRVNKAGMAIRKGIATQDDQDCVDLWRAAHAHVLNTFQAMLRGRAKSQNVVVAQRHKRKTTIFGKLKRFPGMELSRMDDIAGCRLIFDNIKDLYKFRNKLHSARFDHVMRNDINKYDYIKSPKFTGYRGIHDVYEYNVQSMKGKGKDCKGLLIELQYRTRIQHAWATAVELIGIITTSLPKFQEGDKRYEEIMGYASEIIARAHENMTSCHSTLNDRDVVTHFRDLDAQLDLLKLFRGLSSSGSASKYFRGSKNVILLSRGSGDIEASSYRSSSEALKALFRLEALYPDADVVLVRGESVEDLRFSFKNYFSDAGEFIALIEDGCKKLTGGTFRRS